MSDIYAILTNGVNVGCSPLHGSVKSGPSCLLWHESGSRKAPLIVLISGINLLSPTAACHLAAAESDTNLPAHRGQ